jgi:hypothetical protein
MRCGIDATEGPGVTIVLGRASEFLQEAGRARRAGSNRNTVEKASSHSTSNWRRRRSHGFARQAEGGPDLEIASASSAQAIEEAREQSKWPRQECPQRPFAHIRKPSAQLDPAVVLGRGGERQARISGGGPGKVWIDDPTAGIKGAEPARVPNSVKSGDQLADQVFCVTFCTATFVLNGSAPDHRNSIGKKVSDPALDSVWLRILTPLLPRTGPVTCMCVGSASRLADGREWLARRPM